MKLALRVVLIAVVNVALTQAWSAETGMVLAKSASPSETSTAIKALDATQTLKVEKPKDVNSKDLDSEVTDIKLRAGSGAKSKYSTSFYLTYAGGSLKDPGANVRPSVGSERRAAPVSLTGNIGVRYRFNKNKSLFVASGISRPRPFHKNTQNDKFELSTPYLGYNDTLAINDWQLSSGFRLYIVTEKFLKDIGEIATLGYSLRSLNKLGQTRFNGNISLDAWVTGYDESHNYMKKNQNDMGISLTPALQYNYSDKMNFFTSLSLLTYSHYRSDKSFKASQDKITQSLGMGFAIYRDFYVSPSMTFEPENIRSDKTAVNVSTYINL
jgi:hypothetical protein